MKKWLVALIIVIVSATLCFGLVACSSEESDIYYEVKGSSIDESSWIKIGGGKWSDDSGESGTYELDGDKITILQDGEELMTGTLKDGTLTLEMMGMPVGMYITKDAYENLKASNREKVPSSGGDQGVSDKEPSSGEGISEGDPSENAQTTYTVTFDANGGALTGARRLTVDAGSKIEAPAAPVYDGHVFVGWSVSTIEKSLWDFSSDTVTKSITLYAYWENEIVVSFNANGGSFLSGDKVKTSIVEKGSRTSAPETPSRENYIFTHWFADARLTARWDFENDTVTSSITLYAGWVYDEKDVTFVLNYDGANNEVKKTTNGKVDYTPERAGYVFNGWWLSSGQTSAGYILSKKFDVSNVVSQNGLTLYAEWVDAATQASQLRAPGVSIENGVFSWDAVPNAEGYRVTVYKSNKNVSEMDTVIHATTWTFPDYYDTGYYTVKIRSNGDGLNTINSSYVTKSYAHMILPSVTDISMDISTSIVTWSALDYPANYDVYVNNQLAVSTPSTLFDLSDYEAGSYTIKIEASYGSYTHSVSSRSVMKYRLKSPVVNIDLNNESTDYLYLVSWEEILHANQYIVTINGKEIRTEELSYRISLDGELNDEYDEVTISVAAFDTLADYLISVNNAEQKREKLYFVTLCKDPEDGGEVSEASKTFVVGEEVAISATANLGYTWLGWYDGETKVSEADSLTFIFPMPAENKKYIARFKMCEDHSPNSSCICTNCGKIVHGIAEGVHCRHDNYIYFGSYPQSEVTDTSITTALCSAAGTLPTSSDSQKWTSYAYYFEGSPSDYMWYIDLEYSGEKYRGVYFTSYRPSYFTNVSSSSANSPAANSCQDENGYDPGNVYWFKYDPIKWRILSEFDGEALILCESIIDAREYYPSRSTSSFAHNGGTGLANNYELSNIRKWLNDTFYNTAFTDLQREIILLTMVDNGIASTGDSSNQSEFSNTEDKVFLLSLAEVQNSEYGFLDNASRQKKTTDYANSQGAFQNSMVIKCWWLRSPVYGSYGYYVYCVDSEHTSSLCYVGTTCYGVVPALKISLS